MNSLLLSVAAVLSNFAASGMDHTPLDALLKAYVSDSLVDYNGLKENRAALDRYLEEAGNITLPTFQGWSQNDQLAFLINVYNASTLQLIIDGYPVDSIKSLGSFISSPWDKKSVLLFGKKVSLDTLEHKIIRKNYAEPRIHFALVCAALGCPSLRGEAYLGDALDAQLDDQTRSFLNTPEKNRLDREKKVLWLSPIFKWYRSDFEATSNSLNAFVAPYMDAPDTAKNLEGFELSFTDYDWALNDQAKGSK